MKLDRPGATALVSRMVRQIANDRQVSIDARAVKLLATPKNQFQLQSQIEIDEDKLRQTLEDILARVPKARFLAGPITDQDISQALASTNCHYLWFC
jgi:hypothetical protein